MSVPQEITRLVERFEAHREAYQSGKYNEAQIRAEFIDPFFKALGWDVNNEQGYAEAYKDVVHEDAIKISSATKAPDLCFRIGGTRKFFVECKKPSVNIKDAIHPAYQLRRYAWSARLPLSILTDFDELAVYDCRARPDKRDSASACRLIYLTGSQYAEKWDELAAIFSREAVLKGSFDKYAESARGKKGTTGVDDAFLGEIERWRDLLARNIALRNEKLSQRELNFAVQRTIDRIIFLRISEDRGIEPYGRLLTLKNGERAYPRLCDFFRRADERYNSGIFCFTKTGPGGEPADELTLTLKIDDKVITGIIGNLYYPESPYEFSVLPADILGQVYERFLGKVIRLTAGHQAKVEDKPEVRKAGGVYYTPTYIVDYIVKNTVGKLIEDIVSRKGAKSPGKAILQEVAALKILDPACGSGSFLLGAYQYLLDWHLGQYMQEPGKWTKGKAPKLYQHHKGGWKLTTDERKRILLANIYGVDIDTQAVEVTKLSLLLKVLEGESQETITKQFELFHQRALPDLGSNIKCGNSLIGPDFYQQQQLNLPDDEARYRINAFDWQAEFSEIMNPGGPVHRPVRRSFSEDGSLGEGGFDAVIGNPPYIRIQTMKEWAPVEVELFKTIYRSASAGNYDIYVVFVEKGLTLLNNSGRLGFILPHKFFNAQYGEALRKIISGGKHLAHVVHFGDQQVFASATTYTCLMFLDKAGANECQIVKIDDLDAWRTEGKATEGQIPAKTIATAEWNFAVGAGAGLFDKLSKCPMKLGDIAHLFVGVQTDADDVFILEKIKRSDKRVLCSSKFTGRQHWFEDGHLKPFLKGSLNIRRYNFSDDTKLLLFPYETQSEKSILISADAYRKRFPLTWAYLEECRERLTKRNKGRMGSEWYGYVYKKNHVRMCTRKLLTPSIATGSCFAADLDGIYYFVGSGGGGGGGYGISLLPEVQLHYLYILALLNSRLLSKHLTSVSTPFRGGYIALNRQYIEVMPIRPIDFSKPDDKSRHDKMVELADRMLDLHKKLSVAKAPHDKEFLQRQISTTDQEIDRLVYELYGLTEEEIKIVERNGRE
jgi:type I restriction-modification system DNA methylase subunit